MKGQEGHRSTSSCAACKFLKRKCIPNCTFAPYFRSDELGKFAKVHKVFGASNVSKILSEVPEELRADTVNSLAYEAEARLRDPVFGCIGAIALLQRRMVQLQHDLAIARARLARYTNTNNSDSLLYEGTRSTSESKPIIIDSSSSDQFERRGLLLDVAVGALFSAGSTSSSNTSGNLGLQQHYGCFMNVSPLRTNWFPP